MSKRGGLGAKKIARTRRALVRRIAREETRAPLLVMTGRGFTLKGLRFKETGAERRAQVEIEGATRRLQRAGYNFLKTE